MDLKAYDIDFPIDSILRKDVEAFIDAKQTGKKLFNCETSKIDGDIQACLNAGTITKAQTDFIYKHFVFNW